MEKKFQRNTENFECEHCGAVVEGDGYTNHCPKCLWSKHVDVNPGDRAATCKGMMSATGIEKKGNEWVITHKCIRCGREKRNRTDEKDDFEEVSKIGS